MSLAGASVIKMAHAYLGAEAFRRWDQWDGWMGWLVLQTTWLAMEKSSFLIYSSSQIDRKLMIDDYVSGLIYIYIYREIFS